MIDKSASVQVNSNVTIRVLNKNNEVIQTIKKHNKATVLMVEGLLHFLQGWYSNTEFNSGLGGGTPEDSSIYIPTKLGFGNIGVKTEVEPAYGNVPMFSSVSRGDFVEPTFSTTRLQSPLLKWSDDDLSYIEHETFSDTEITSYEDLNNSESLRLISKIQPGRLVGEMAYVEGSTDPVFVPYERSFYDPISQQWATMITEIGLFSNEGSLLARVLLDSPVSREEVSNELGLIGYSYGYDNPESPSNPLVQTQETTLVVEWRIGLVSVSDKDHFVTQNNIKYKELADELSSQIVVFTEEQGVVPNSSQIEAMIYDILIGYDDISNTNN